MLMPTHVQHTQPTPVGATAADLALLEPFDTASPEGQAEWHRKVGHARAVAFLVEGQPGRAYAEVMRTFLRQVRVLGLGYTAIPGHPYDEGGPLG